LDSWAYDENQEVSIIVEREYGALGTYKEIIDKLCDVFSDRPIYFFSYDWRQDNESNAEILRQFIEQLTAGGGKVDLVCHSMGGLVASSYYKMYPDDHRTGKIITAGTPYEGSPFIFGAVLKGDITDSGLDNFGLDWIVGFTKDIKKQYWSVPQLTPTKQYVEKVPFKWVYDNVEIGYSRYSMICDNIFGEINAGLGRAFQEELRVNGYNALLGHPNSYFLIGRGQKTIDSVKFNFSNEHDENIYDIDYNSLGDGKVPYQSGSMMEQVAASRRFIFYTDHSGLVGHPSDGTAYSDKIAAANSLNKIVEILGGNVSQPSATIPNGKGLTTIRAACPVDATVTHDGETLTSNEASYNDLSSFGRMDLIGEDGEIKMFCVDEGAFPVTLEGTGSGTMDYSIRFYDENNNLLGERAFEDVKITDKTIITTDTGRGAATVLKVDEDGDGVVDYTLSSASSIKDTPGGGDPGGSGGSGNSGGGGGGCNAGFGIALVALAGVVASRKRKK
jgi:hypothetical protein